MTPGFAPVNFERIMGAATINVKALTFDTGGTILDWHSGVCSVFQKIGEHHGLSLDWHVVTNDYRRLAMKDIVGQVQPTFNMDDVHRCPWCCAGRFPEK